MNIENFIPLLSDDILNKYSFFQLYPFDGGGNFVSGDILGSVNDEKIADRILNHGALDMFGGYENIDYHKSDSWKTIEQSSWINRLYFIVPLAKYAKAHNDINTAQKIVNIILDFGRNNWGPDTKEEVYAYEAEVNEARRNYNSGSLRNDYINYQWYDFQPASRIIHIIYALYFIKDFLPEICRNEKFFNADNKIDELIYHHAEVINWGEEDLKHLAPGNHQALRGMALMLACDYFKDCPASWIKTAEKICDYHILNDFLPDGMLIDISPSYHFFECWIMRDVKTLAERNGFFISEEACKRLEKAFELCYILRQPDGYSSVISDGYSLNMNVFLQTVKTEKTDNKDKYYLENTGFAIYKKDNDFMLFDCSDVGKGDSHLHGGKQGITLFIGGKPFLCDSGCCNYDYKEFETYYKHPSAHSSLLVNGEGDSRINGKYTWVNSCKCSLENWQDNSVQSTLVSDMPQWKNTVWTRKISFDNSVCQISDTVRSDEEKEYAFIFNLHFNAKAEKINEKSLYLINDNVRLKAEFSAPFEISDGMICSDCKNIPTNKITVKIKSKNCSLETVFKKI